MLQLRHCGAITSVPDEIWDQLHASQTTKEDIFLNLNLNKTFIKTLIGLGMISGQ